MVNKTSDCKTRWWYASEQFLSSAAPKLWDAKEEDLISRIIVSPRAVRAGRTNSLQKQTDCWRNDHGTLHLNFREVPVSRGPPGKGTEPFFTGMAHLSFTSEPRYRCCHDQLQTIMLRTELEGENEANSSTLKSHTMFLIISNTAGLIPSSDSQQSHLETCDSHGNSISRQTRCHSPFI